MDTVEKNINLDEIKKELKSEEKKLFIKKILSNKLLITGSVITIFLVLVSIFGPLIVSNDPYEADTSIRLQAPSSEYILGTDDFGRDLLSRIVYGARNTMIVGAVTSSICAILGLIIGLYSSYYRFLDQILMRIMDGLMSIPAILLAIALMSALGPSIINTIIALSIVLTPSVARVVRSSALVIKEQTYIEAMIAQGSETWRIIWFHILPNTLSPLIVQATFVFAEVILTEATLSFLGAGVPPPDPSWGNILADGKAVIYQAWWMTVFPGIMLILSVLGLNLLGDGLRDMLDPHNK